MSPANLKPPPAYESMEALRADKRVAKAHVAVGGYIYIELDDRYALDHGGREMVVTDLAHAARKMQWVDYVGPGARRT